MRGGDRTRHCESCSKTVHNLSAMSRAEGEELIRNLRPEQRLCVLMDYHPDGRIVTADDPRPAPTPPPRPSVAAALALGAGLLAACTGDKSRSESAEGADSPVAEEREHVVPGQEEPPTCEEHGDSAEPYHELRTIGYVDINEE